MSITVEQGVAAYKLIVAAGVIKNYMDTPDANAHEFMLDAGIHIISALAILCKNKLPVPVKAAVWAVNSVMISYRGVDALLKGVGFFSSSIPTFVNEVDVLNHADNLGIENSATCKLG